MKYLRNTCIAALLAHSLAASAWDPYDTPEDFHAWLKANQTAEPQFVDGDVIGFDRADLLQPFVPPAYQEEMFFEGMQVTIKDAGDLTPPAIFKDATAKFYDQASVDANGGIQNYTIGLPFDPTKFTPGSKEDGYKLGWNFNFRWQNEGAQTNEVVWVWVRKGGNHDNHELMRTHQARFYQGGGTFERVLFGTYKRVYLSHRVDLPESNYTVPGTWAKGAEWREHTGFDAPFDIAGTAFLILRHDDSHKADDSWAYIPSLRRVRRISVEVKSDSLLGTDLTLEDFYCFAGRIAEWEWEYLGTARMLAVARSRNLNTTYYGPNGWTPLDDWAVRVMDVASMTPKRPNHPYSTKILMLDRDTAACYYSENYDRAGKMWKVIQLSKAWSEEPYFHEEWDYPVKGAPTPKGTRMTAFQSINTIDKQNRRGTLVPTHGIGYPENTDKVIRRRLDVNYLTEGR